MSLSPLMSLGMKALAANYAALQTTGNNIANASVVGYSRQQVELSTSPGQFTGAGFFGRGVDVASVTRSHDEFLTREAAATKAMASMDSARLAKLQQLETIFKPGEGGLGDATTQLFNAFVDMASQPNDLSARQVALARAADLASRFNESASALKSIQDGVDADLGVSVAQVNSLARSIANANQRIVELRGLGQPANDLLDERDRLIGKLSEQLQVTRIDAPDGSVGVFIGGGQRLVLGSNAAELKLVPDASDPTRSAVAVMDGSNPRTLDESVLGGGKVAGLLRFQNNDLAAARDLLGELASEVTTAVNDQQARGLTLGQAAGPALFALDPANGIGMTVLLADPKDLAAASPLVATTAATNLGTAAVAELRVTAAPLPFPGVSETFTFADAVAPATGFTYTSSLTGVALPWVPGQALQGANGFTLQISGVPAAGDVIAVDPTPASALASNNGNALSLAALRDAALVGGRTLTDAWAQAMADVGVRTQSAQASSEISTAVADQAELSRSSQAGINLDEEAARLIQYQQSYQAAAKVLQVAQAIFDTLLQTAAR
ncbi:MAG: flagellar hook-associated protein FlgK [Rubrivivax sp.]|nr:flagellar hook-associated protein FlgK [Rubrivivax sp.]